MGAHTMRLTLSTISSNLIDTMKALSSKHILALFAKVLAFCLILALGLGFLQSALLPPAASTDSWPGYLRQDKNTVDVLFVGNSHAECTFAPMQIYQETGVISWVLKSGGINTRQKLAYLEEALKTQHPKLVVFEVYGFEIPTKNTDYRNASAFMRMPDGIPKISAIFATSEVTATPSLLLPLIRYHSRIFESPEVPVISGLQSTGGALALTDYGSSNINEMLNSANASPIQRLTKQQLDENTSYLERAFKLANKHGCQLAFAVSPLLDPTLKAGCEQIKKRIADDQNLNDVELFDMNDYFQSMGLRQADFRDLSHLYLTGQTKASKWFANTVLPRYGINQATALTPVQKQWWDEQSSAWLREY